MPAKTRPSAREIATFAIDNVPFIGFHVATVVLVALTDVTWPALALAVLLYAARMFGITAGYHRYFSHRTYKTSRPVQFVLALLGVLTLQKGPIWWASQHRQHHRFSDQEEDPHSPVRHGFFWSHMGWIMSERHKETVWDQVKDLSKFPELRLLDRYQVVPFVLLCAVVLAGLGLEALVWGCFVSTVALFHATFCINSLAHVWGRRVYETGDASRNNLALALVTFGEGWHNNHHFYAAAANQGFRWWQVDLSFYLLVVLEKLGLVWDLRRAPQDVVAGYRGGKLCLVGGGQPSAVSNLPEEPGEDARRLQASGSRAAT